MTTRTAERLEDWESRPFTDGYDGLQALAESSFSGAVTAGRATLYMLNGSVVGILDGSIEDFEDASGTIFEAPTPALPLLAVMQERGDEVRAKYYSEETPLSDADRKLSEGGFTGYVELSENVLSGDYFVVYHGGKSMSVAYVGESEQLITDEEAFQKADEEVGIYKVRPVDVEPIEIPEPESENQQEEAVAAATTDEAGADTEAEASSSTNDSAEADRDTTADSSEPERDRDADATTEEPDPADTEASAERQPDQRASADDGRSSDRQTRSGEPDRREETGGQHTPAGSDRATRQDEPDRGSPDRRDRREETGHRERTEPARQESTARSSDRDERPPAPGRRSEDAGRSETAGRTAGERDRAPSGRDRRESPRQPREDRARTQDTRRQHQESPAQGSRESGQEIPGSEGAIAASEASDGATGGDAPPELEHRTIPSVDPARTWTPDDSESNAASSRERPRSENTSSQAAPSQPGSNQSRPAGQSTRSNPSSQQADQARQAAEADLQAAEAEITELEQRLEDLQATNDDLVAEREEIENERAEIEVELERVRSERDDLQAEVEELRETVSELRNRLEQTEGEAATAETTLSPREAIDGTNLFVRYASKGEATLKSAHDGSADAEEVDENLNLEYHTQFDTESTAVDGQPYEEFLVNTIHYRFVSWMVRDLLYEIRDTGHRDALSDLYDALPRIDRAELNATVSVTYVEDGEEQRSQETFDIVLRDRMGNPLVVTNLNDSRAAATDEMMTTLVTSATHVGETSDRLAGAFFVTSSFFDPDALETASEATGGGILSRDKRESFVRLSRKDGFHLCLVESRDSDFHLAVPEL